MPPLTGKSIVVTGGSRWVSSALQLYLSQLARKRRLQLAWCTPAAGHSVQEPACPCSGALTTNSPCAVLMCRGIGHGLVKKLLERSNKVIATARVPQDAQQLQQLAAENSNLIVAALDVSQPDSITQFAAEVKKHTQHVDVSVGRSRCSWPCLAPPSSSRVAHASQ